MATTKTSSTPVPADAAPAVSAPNKTPIIFPSHSAHDLARYSANFFTGIVVAIAFLLLGGLHQPPLWLLVFMYTSLGATALASLLSLPITVLQGLVDVAKPRDSHTVQLATRLRIVQIMQLIVFVIAVAAVVGFAIEMSLLFFPATAAVPAAAQG